LRRQHRRLGPKAETGNPQHAREEAVEPFVVARRHRVARGADIAVMHQQMLRPEMRIEHHRQQQVAQPALQPVLLVHQFVRVVDADGPAHHAHAEEEAMIFSLVRCRSR
jgi:hypothetical protein